MKSPSLRSLKAKLTLVFNRWIRRRDFKKGCISCGQRVGWGRNWHAGHYFTKAATWASLQFDEKNVNGQCGRCNTFLEGNKQGYREGLIKRYGPGIIQQLEVKKMFKNRWGIFEYEVLIRKYSDD